MHPRPLAFRLALIPLLTLLLAACSPRQLLLREAADALATQGATDEQDLVLAREASAFYFKLSESVLAQTPGHLGLSESVAAGLTRYAYAFVALPAEQIERRDIQAAQAQRQRAARLYARAQGHALAALTLRHPDLMQTLDKPQAALALTDDEVGCAYWAAAAWGARIALSKDEPEVVADLPRAVRLAQAAYARQPRWGDGALASLMGSFEAARPGGSVALATRYFDQAIEWAGTHNASVWLAKAEGIAQPAGDRAAFETLLRQAQRAAAARPDLSNQLMRDRAQWLLDQAADLF